MTSESAKRCALLSLLTALLIGQMLKRQFSFFKLVRGIKKQGRIHLKWRMFLIALPVAQFKMPNNFLGADDVIHNKKKVIFITTHLKKYILDPQFIFQLIIHLFLKLQLP